MNNAEILAPGAAGATNSTLFKAGAYYAISSKNTGHMYIAGELEMDTVANTTNLYAALRFAPKKNVNIDVPIFFRLTLGV